MGSIGSPSHMNFQLVGEAVFTAHRMVEIARNGEILISEAIYESLGGKLEGWSFTAKEPVTIKGKSDPVLLYQARLD